jgi:lysophosphatidate acyltransferase
MVDYEMLNSLVGATLFVLHLLARAIFCYACTIPVFSIASTRQEYKVWRKTPTPLTIWGIFKVFVFNIVWMSLCLVGFLALVPLWIMRGCGDSVQVEANGVIEKLVAFGVMEILVGTVEVVNEDKIPPVSYFNGNSPAPVFIANHCSQLDISTVYYAVRRFKWIAKKSVRFIPGPGNLMALGGHVFIQRSGKNSKSVSDLFQLSNEAIQSGVPMFLFPQGTRCVNKKLPFKNGAFRIATANESIIVPMTFNVPSNAWNSLYPINLLWGQKRGEMNKIILTVHDAIPVKKDADIASLNKRCQEIIYSALPPSYHGEDSNRKLK